MTFHPATRLCAGPCELGKSLGLLPDPVRLGDQDSILHYGGMGAFRRGMPIFLGLLLGGVVISCLWPVLGFVLDTQMDYFFP